MSTSISGRVRLQPRPTTVTRRVVLPRLELESGEVLLDAPIAFAAWGRLNRQGDNAVIVCHALTTQPNGGRH